MRVEDRPVVAPGSALLITGASGFIGSRLALLAQAQNMTVVAIGMANTEAERLRIAELEAKGIAVAIGSLQDEDFLRRMVKECHAVIHLAAAQHEANVPDTYFEEVNVEGTRRLLEASIAAGVQRFVYGSTIGVYRSSYGRFLDETSPLRPDNAYGRSKVLAEDVVRSCSKRIAATIVRISETYGPGDFRLLKLFKSLQHHRFMMIGSGENERQPIYVGDLVRGLLTAVHHPAAVGQTFVFAGSQVITTHRLVQEIAKTVGRAPNYWHAPPRPFMWLARLMELTFVPLGIQPPLHRRRLDFFLKSFRFSTGKARSVLGFAASTTLPQGIRETAAWYRERGLLPAISGLEAAPSHASSLSVPEVSLPDRHWQYSDILEYTHDAIIIWEMDGKGILYWNQAAEHLYGYARAQAQGRTTHELLKTQLQGGVANLEERLSRYGVWVGELRHTTSDERQIVVQARLALMSQHNGRWLVLEVNRDVTAEKQIEEMQAAVHCHVQAMR